MEVDDTEDYEPEESDAEEEEVVSDYEPEEDTSADEDSMDEDSQASLSDQEEEDQEVQENKSDGEHNNKTKKNKSAADGKKSSRHLSPFEVAEFEKTIMNPPTCNVCHKHLNVQKGLENYLPKELRSRLKEMTARNNFCSAKFFTKDKSSQFYCKPVNCSNCIQVAKEDKVEQSKVAELKCKDCGVKLFFKEDKSMAKHLSNPTIREKRGYSQVKMSMVKKDQIFVEWVVDAKCSGGCKDKSQLRQATIRGQPGSGACLLANFQGHGLAMNQAATQYLDMNERKQVQMTLSSQVVHNICHAMDVSVPEEKEIAPMYEDLVKDKSLVRQPYDLEEQANLHNILTKIRNFFAGTQINNRQKRMMCLTKFLLIKYPQELQVDRQEFADYAKRQGWWTEDTNGNFSDNFTITDFSGYNKPHSYVHLVDVDLSQPDRPWRINTRVWARLYKFLKNERVDGESYLSRIQNLLPQSWTQDIVIHDAPESPQSYLGHGMVTPATPRDDQDPPNMLAMIRMGVSRYFAAQVNAMTKPISVSDAEKKFLSDNQWMKAPELLAQVTQELDVKHFLRNLSTQCKIAGTLKPENQMYN